MNRSIKEESEDTQPAARQLEIRAFLNQLLQALMDDPETVAQIHQWSEAKAKASQTSRLSEPGQIIRSGDLENQISKIGRPRQCSLERVMKMIQVLNVEYGRKPTLEEIRVALGVGSRRTVQRYLKELENRKLASPRRARSLR